MSFLLKLVYRDFTRRKSMTAFALLAIMATCGLIVWFVATVNPTAFSEDGSVHRFSFSPDVDFYVKNQRLTSVEEESLSPREAVEELVLMSLRYKGGLDLGRLEKMVGKRIGSDVFKGLKGFRIFKDHLVPDDEGLMVSDAAASAILDALY